MAELSDTDRMKRAIEVHKNWIWHDRLEALALRKRVSQLELDLHDVREFINRILAKSDN